MNSESGNDTSPLRIAYESFLATQDESTLLRAVLDHGGKAPTDDADSPLVHRIHDINLEGNWFRVVRTVSMPHGETELLIYPTNAGSEKQGVPYALKGENLLRWVRDELNSETEDRSPWYVTEWSKYLDLS